MWFSSPFAVVAVEKRKSALALWRGTDEFDRFAAALGATLPRIADGPTESNGGESEGNSEYLEAKESDSESEEGSKTPVARTPPAEKTRPLRIGMAGVMRINPFVGRGDGKENPADYIADVEMAARRWDASYGADSDNPEASKIALFRQNLDRNGDAWHWWCGRARWWICGSVWAVAMGWRVSGGDPQVFRFICFYGSLYSRVFPRS